VNLIKWNKNKNDQEMRTSSNEEAAQKKRTKTKPGEREQQGKNQGIK